MLLMDQQQDAFDPLRIALTVVSGRSFQGKKKGDQCHASVVFGLGKELYQTEIIVSNDPYWNQEAHVNVTSKANDSLLFKIKDQGHTVGVVKIPVKTITRRKSEEWYPINPYKKEKDFHGEIRLSCYVSDFRLLSPSTVNSSGSSEDMLDHCEKKKSYGILHPTISSVLLKSSPVGPRRNNAEPRAEVPTPGHDVCLLPSDEDNNQAPEVSGISPSEGSIEGNERVILRGSNLGDSKDDVVRVTIVNIDCTNSMEYYSSGKLIITTLPRKVPGKGPVIVETLSGGVGISALHYSYVSPAVSATSNNDRSSDNNTVVPIAPKLSGQEVSEMQSENRFMKQQIKELKESNKYLHDDNMALREYIEQLLSTIIDHKPELLEIAQKKKHLSNASEIIDKLLIS